MTVKIWYKIEELEETSINFEQNKTVDDLKKAIIKNEPSVLKDCTSSEINLKITKDGDSKIHIVSPRWIIQKVLQEHGNDFLCLICKKGMENTCTPEDLNILFRISDTEDAYEFITKTLSAPIRNNPPSREGTEYSFSLQDVIGWHETPEFRPIEREDQTVEVCATNIKKTFTNPEKSDARVEKLKNVYDILTKKKVPNVDRLIHADNESGVVYLGPKGMSVKPKNQKELIEAVFCVLETLVVLHDGDEPIFHQDIRWPNIIKLPGEQSKWILIDWDDADGPPTRPVSHLGKENHAPEVFKEGHGGEVDIWSVGKLITDANNWIIGISQDIIEFGVQMQSNRPSAHDALELFRPFTQ
ncbi:15235_t:CDS:2 [Funneliformis geosporum]|uniref:15235_t:CDS:1 n=1 Tax=Funneliformis geosporum TaxID=1117311 RepID=A0A9W4X3Z4_9GLOM|nr:15235_t:CDS:2 [Funneliformis geosporum]